MNSIIFGANGRTGRLLVEQAEALGHQVTAFVRNPGSLLRLSPATKIIRGDLMDATAVTRAIEGQDVILSAVGVPASAARAPTTFFSQGMKNMVDGARQAGVGRIICLGSCGSDPETKALLPLKILGDLIITPLFFRGIYDDYVRMEAWLAEIDLDWTVMRPPLLTDGGLTTRYRRGVGQHLKGIARISRADLAHCVLASISDAATYRRWVEVAY